VRLRRWGKKKARTMAGKREEGTPDVFTGKEGGVTDRLGTIKLTRDRSERCLPIIRWGENTSVFILLEKGGGQRPMWVRVPAACVEEEGNGPDDPKRPAFLGEGTQRFNGEGGGGWGTGERRGGEVGKIGQKGCRLSFEPPKEKGNLREGVLFYNERGVEVLDRSGRSDCEGKKNLFTERGL